MSKIQSIQPNYQQKSNLKSEKTENFASRQSFGLKWDDVPKDAQKKILDAAKESLNKKSGPLGWFFEKVGQGKGEIQSQMINNLFTATLAPYVIANNPFTKKSKEDKAYLAWRQPLSAGVALAGALPITLAINSYLNKTYDEGYNKFIDLRWNPSKSYLKKQFKLSKSKKTYEEFADDFKNKRLDLFTSLLSEDPNKIKIDEKTKAISIIKDDKTTEIGKNIPNITNQKQLNSFLDEYNFHNRTIGDFLEKSFGFEFHKEGALEGQLKNNAADKKLSEVKALDFLKELGIFDGDSVNDSKLREAISKLRQEKNSPELGEILFFNNNPGTASRAKKAFELFGKDGARSNEMMMGEKLGKETSTTLGQFLHQLEYKIYPNSDGYEPLQKFMDMKIKDALDKFKKIFDDQKLEGFKSKSNINDFAKNMLNGLAKRNESYAGSHKTKIGMILNIGVVIITCSILNWVYPKFMEKFHPDLVQNHKKGGHK